MALGSLNSELGACILPNSCALPRETVRTDCGTIGALFEIVNASFNAASISFARRVTITQPLQNGGAL